MNTTDFYNHAVRSAVERGFENPQIATFSGFRFAGKLVHSCCIRIEMELVESGYHADPVAAIMAFKDRLDLYNKKYSKESSDVEID